MTTIRSKIDTIFYFTINGSSLKLFDPSGWAPFVFNRTTNPVGTAINGLWQTLTVAGSNQLSEIQMNGTHALLCQGQGLAIYNITSSNGIIFTILKSKGCSTAEVDVLRALDSSVVYRIRDHSILYLYDYKLNVILTAYFTKVIQLNQTLENIGK